MIAKLLEPDGYEDGALLNPKEITRKEGPADRVETMAPPIPLVHEDAPEFHAEPAGGQTIVVGCERLTRPVTVFPVVPDAATAPATPAGTGKNCIVHTPVPGEDTTVPRQSSVL